MVMIMYYKSVYKSPLGELYLVSEDNVLIETHFESDRYPSKILNDAQPDPGLDCMAEAHVWLDRYFAGLRPSPYELRLAPRGTEFRMRVWDILKAIPYGNVLTYADVAEIIAREKGLESMSAQAVGGAIGHNPIGIIIPCHRVIGSDGGMTGFGGGIENKIWLLKHEGHGDELDYSHTGDFWHERPLQKKRRSTAPSE